ncbi:protein FAR1-RELATED SEQUENCE 6-like [Coffea arabica]|uniref:Protein FAR1-RELATED SEQUENCE 6-like n=1 Tax=Coffea arabica TaxID=13443 RepID=A0A6P6X9X3_COFAR
MNNEHTNCSHVWKNKNISAKWLANKYMERFRCNVEMPPRLLRQIVDEDFKAEISKWVAYNARAIAKKEIQGNAEQQYKDIWRYCAEIKRTHPNTTMEVMFTPFRQPGCNPKFMRLYCCLGPLKQGFLDGCRPIIRVDGCHIKAEYRGQLLTAIGVDPNNGWWPIAWAVVEREATEQWKWFFELLKNDLQIENGYSYTFVSDQQKGLDRALSEVLPNSEHRYCVQHLYNNFKKKHRGLALKTKLWNIAASTTEGLFKKASADLENFDKEAYEWVKKAPHPSHWCKTFFSEHTRCDMLVNNLCESFNGHILEARQQPIITMLESIRIFLMERIQRRTTAMEKFELSIGPLIKKIIDDRVIESRQWRTIWNVVDGYQVRGPRGAQFAVYLKKKSCTCKLWDLSGIPCCHAIAAIHRNNGDPYKEVYDCYNRDLFLKIYKNVLYPINGQVMWPETDGVDLDPPERIVQPGRPKKARRRDPTETQKTGNSWLQGAATRQSTTAESG